MPRRSEISGRPEPKFSITTMNVYVENTIFYPNVMSYVIKIIIFRLLFNITACGRNLITPLLHQIISVQYSEQCDAFNTKNKNQVNARFGLSTSIFKLKYIIQLTLLLRQITGHILQPSVQQQQRQPQSSQRTLTGRFFLRQLLTLLMLALNSSGAT